MCLFLLGVITSLDEVRGCLFVCSFSRYSRVSVSARCHHIPCRSERLSICLFIQSLFPCVCFCSVSSHPLSKWKVVYLLVQSCVIPVCLFLLGVIDRLRSLIIGYMGYMSGLGMVDRQAPMFPLAFVAGSLQGHWWGFISPNYVVWPIFFLMNVFIALKASLTFKCMTEHLFADFSYSIALDTYLWKQMMQMIRKLIHIWYNVDKKHLLFTKRKCHKFSWLFTASRCSPRRRSICACRIAFEVLVSIGLYSLSFGFLKKGFLLGKPCL